MRRLSQKLVDSLKVPLSIGSLKFTLFRDLYIFDMIIVLLCGGDYYPLLRFFLLIKGIALNPNSKASPFSSSCLTGGETSSVT